MWITTTEVSLREVLRANESSHHDGLHILIEEEGRLLPQVTSSISLPASPSSRCCSPLGLPVIHESRRGICPVHCLVRFAIRGAFTGFQQCRFGGIVSSHCNFQWATYCRCALCGYPLLGKANHHRHILECGWQAESPTYSGKYLCDSVRGLEHDPACSYQYHFRNCLLDRTFQSQRNSVLPRCDHARLFQHFQRSEQSDRLACYLEFRFLLEYLPTFCLRHRNVCLSANPCRYSLAPGIHFSSGRFEPKSWDSSYLQYWGWHGLFHGFFRLHVAFSVPSQWYSSSKHIRHRLGGVSHRRDLHW